RVPAVAKMQRRRRRYGHFRRRPGVRFDEAKMIEHGVSGKTDLALHAQQHGLRLRSLKLDLALADVGFNAFQLFEKVDLPEGAPELTVGDRPQPDLLLLANDRLNLTVFDRSECRSVNLAALVTDAGIFQSSGAQQAADMIGAKRGRCSSHDLSPHDERCPTRPSSSFGPLRFPTWRSAPDLPREIHDHPQLRPLVLLGH